jgi:acetyl-CoA acyltransferase
VSEAGLAKLGLKESDCVEVAGVGHSVASLYEDGDFTRLTTTANAAAKAYASAGITPADVDVAEVHDCFTVTELMMIEALGLAEPGQGAEFTKSGATAIAGSTPVNTGGGLIGFGHPVGATGIKQPLEIFRQMKGKCGEYQVPKDLRWGITANMGGDDKTVVSLALKNLG